LSEVMHDPRPSVMDRWLASFWLVNCCRAQGGKVRIRWAMIAIGLGLALCGSGLRIGVEALASLDAELARIDVALQ
jgi:hypothetical protein